MSNKTPLLVGLAGGLALWHFAPGSRPGLRNASDGSTRNANSETFSTFTLVTYPEGIGGARKTNWFRTDAPMTWSAARDQLVAARLIDPTAISPNQAGYWKLVTDARVFMPTRAKPLDSARNSYIATTFTLVVYPEGVGGPKRTRWRPGQSLGTIGANPLDSAHLAHLHFELWKGGKRTGAVDPSPYLATWTRVSVPWSPTIVATASPTPRNGNTSVYRQLGGRGEPYPDWVRALKGKAGVYIIRDATTHECLYVGSSAGRLYDTLTRHFQVWRRYKGFWRGQYGEGADPGLTYPRADVEVAVRITSPGAALDDEMRTIARLRPRDNQIGQPDAAADESVPF